MDYRIREMKEEEYSLLSDFLYEAIFVPPGTEPPPKTVLATPELQVYIQDFGHHPHDHALVVEVQEEIVGAIWARLMHDYGHLDEDTPSLAMSVKQAYRHLGLGTALLAQLLSHLKIKGYPKVSLSVQKANYAVKMYEKAGFHLAAEKGDEYIMLAYL